ncbi:DNA-3-methyladenine glycosylase 2 family protein [Lysobacter pythonis]|uniref:DNA-3-methyladenine glycosylase II n=1 Tax=Solilutibacter pythonis TaxID=2483112 RepID=A0A3M2HWX0_9GAMM|nr:DNA-3-methyladenine glycosylase 2 [Lysobacter pythonis]RMH93568.1 DNA-3-methyladenine glycosylase 2 family protein [Lysobacter pythonis]
MTTPPPPPAPGPAPPPVALCEQARRARDARFDGVFFTAVKTTGIYCRPVCPAPAPKAANVEYFAHAAAAEAAGYRPCLRCRPELAPDAGGWRRGEHILARGLRLIEDGLLDDAPMARLAERLHVGERHLRRLFVATLGVTPQQVQGTRRLLFAKRLLTETALPVTDVALAAGFRSLRRFNDAFANAYGMPPGRLRQSADAPPDPGPLRLKLGYRPPFDFRASLAFLRARALPGIERVDDDAYTRVIDAAGAWLELREWGSDEPALRLSLYGLAPAMLPGIVRRVRRMFDLDADPQTIQARLGDDPLLTPLIARHPGLRLPGGWDGFEVAVRAVLGQQVSVAAAVTLARRLVAKHGEALANPVNDQLHTLFPCPARLAAADLAHVGLPGKRAATLQALARAVRDGRVDFRSEQPLDEFVARWRTIPGIGDWTAHYIALRGLHHPDAFPAGDLVLRKQAGGGAALTEKQLLARAEGWRPWRGYAVIQLWRAAAAAPLKEPTP